MVSHGRVELLAHPLSQKYLQMKWNSYGKYFHLANLLFYSVFLLFITLFSSQLMRNIHELEPGETLKSLSPHRKNESLLRTHFDNRILEQHVQLNSIMVVSGFGVLVYIVISTIREIIQIYQQKWHYLLEPINLVSWFLYISSAVTVSPMFFGGKMSDAHYSAASITVFLSWFNLLLFLQRFDQVILI